MAVPSLSSSLKYSIIQYLPQSDRTSGKVAAHYFTSMA